MNPYLLFHHIVKEGNYLYLKSFNPNFKIKMYYYLGSIFFPKYSSIDLPKVFLRSHTSAKETLVKNSFENY